MDPVMTAVLTATTSAVVSVVASSVVTAIRKATHRGDDVDEALRSVLRAELLQIFIFYCVGDEDGTRPIPLIVRETADSVYQRYHRIGGNGTGTYIYEEICRHPTTADFRHRIG